MKPICQKRRTRGERAQRYNEGVVDDPAIHAEPATTYELISEELEPKNVQNLRASPWEQVLSQ